MPKLTQAAVMAADSSSQHHFWCSPADPAELVRECSRHNSILLNALAHVAVVAAAISAGQATAEAVASPTADTSGHLDRAGKRGLSVLRQRAVEAEIKRFEKRLAEGKLTAADRAAIASLPLAGYAPMNAP